MQQQKKKIFVGLSGGVDSSVSAALLKEEGHDVTGVFIKVWQADFLPCTWREERREAMRAAVHIGIPFLTLDLEREYKEEVVDYMIREYGEGRVPNPDVMCNTHVKFGAFLSFARAHGADAIATGHYARVQSSVISHQSSTSFLQSSVISHQLSGNTEGENLNHLYAGVDPEKDQSYFLWTLGEEQLARTLFPVGGLLKSEVRAKASALRLPNAKKKDSQGLCFMGQVDMEDFLRHYLQVAEGDVLSEAGEVIGKHHGALLYAIGQRRGFQTKKTSAGDPPLFVISKDLKRNSITVGPRDPVTPLSGSFGIFLKDVHTVGSDDFLLHPSPSLRARFRYRDTLHPVTLSGWDKDHRTIRVDALNLKERVSLGQSVVFYAGEECLGGGVICE